MASGQLWITIGVCHECCKYVDIRICKEIRIGIFECYHCSYPNSLRDLGIVQKGSVYG